MTIHSAAAAAADAEQSDNVIAMSAAAEKFPKR
jgi:hypothetical protein